MIVFLTLCYVGLLAVAVKVGIIKLNLFWKLSPLLWMVLLFVILFLPMQWGAPGGSVNVLQYVVEIIPNVNGEVIDVPVEPLKPVQQGAVLFQIDPVPFQAKVDQLKAQLAATIQNVEQLDAAADAAGAQVTKTEEQIVIQQAAVEASDANVEIAKTAVQQAETNLDKVTTLVADLNVQVAAGKRELDRQKDLLEQAAGSAGDVDRAQVQYSQLESQLNLAEADLRSAQQSLTASLASLDAETANQRGVAGELHQLTSAELPRVRAMAREARLAAESMIGNEHTSVADVRAQLAAAEYDLEQTTVRAPSAGHVAFLTLRPGQRVANLPLRSWMAFVNYEDSDAVVTIDQYALRFVEPGQKAEVTFKLFPGKVFDATVDRVAYITSSGQLQPSGQIATYDADRQTAEPYGVVLRIDDDTIDPAKLAGGAKGSAAIYTDSMKATHIIRRVMIRMDAWMNFIIP